MMQSLANFTINVTIECYLFVGLRKNFFHTKGDGGTKQRTKFKQALQAP